jgi:subtilisin family serine protease
MPGNDSGQIVGPLPATSLYYQFAIDWAGRVGVNCSDGLDPNDPDADPLACEETYALLQGTSAAAPHVTGVAALAISRFGKMPTSLLQTHLALRSTRQNCPSNPYLPYPGDMAEATCEGSWLYNGFYGNGIIDAYGAVR